MTRPRLAAAAAVFAVLAAYASIVPFDPSPLTAGQSWRLIVLSWPPALTSKTDFIANVLLQFPFGFLLAGAIAFERPRVESLALFVSTCVAAVLALGVEWAQGMIAARTPSSTDIVAEALGALLGALIWTRCGPMLATVVNRVWSATGSRALVPLGAYAIVWILGRWIPFDFTLRLPELAQKYRAGLLVLWPGAPGADGLAATIGSVAGQWLLAVPLGIAARVFTRPWGTQYRVNAAIVLGAVFAVAVQSAKIFVLSRGVDLGDVAAAGLGAMAGVWWAEQPEDVRGRVVGHFAIATLFLYQWSPFQFSAEARAFALVPFAAYYAINPFQALGEGVFKLQLGFVVGLVAHLGAFIPLVRRVALWIIVFALIEIGQMFLSGRYPDVSDVLLGVVGAVAGIGARVTFRRDEASRHAPLRA